MRALAQSGQPLIIWSWIGDHVGDIVSRGAQHAWLTLLAVGLGLLISFPLAIIAHRHRRLLGPITWVAGVLYTIPSLALISLLVTITGFSYVTVVIPLTTYTLLILIRNTVAGLEGVPADAKDAALGMGFTRRQMLWRVEIPLAMPVIIAGIRIATVSTIGLITVAALIGRGGFGEFILEGLQQLFWTPLLLGVVLSVALALVADLLLIGIGRLTTPWVRSVGVRVVGT
ncbi:MAG: ABC transporter permease [Actinomycetota bacterium]|nr:ABC transporter permease [Actinomycetota bacterium]